MRMAYFLLGIAFFIVIGGLLYFLPSDENTVSEANDAMKTQMTLTSSAFENGDSIPPKFTCDGINVSPPLSIDGVPEGAAALIVVMDDPDVPKVLRSDGVFDHWVVYGIDPNTKEIEEGTAPGSLGLNGRGEASYTGPCPPSEYEPSEHRYFFKLYAVERAMNFSVAPTKAEVLKAIEGGSIEEAELMGRYSRK